MSFNKVVLAYSGGLDTSIMIPWLKEKYGCDVVAFAADVGQQEDMEKVKEKALATGACEAYVLDLKEEFVRDYCFKALKAGAIYEGKYPLGTALNRPIISKYLVDVARKTGADAVVHGATGKGNDQVRFEVSVMALAHDLKCIAPVRTWEFKSRQEEIAYAQERKIPIEVSVEKPYSIDRNLWSISIECGVLEDPWNEPPEDAYLITQSPESAPNEPLYIEIGFEKGVPVTLNGERKGPVEMVTELNDIAGRYGVGRVDIVEDRLVGIKSREIYEAPGATVLLIAHNELEYLVLDRETFRYKEHLAIKYADLVYYGYWFSPLREALDAFVDETQKKVDGVVRLKLYKGTCVPVGRKSPNSLYDFSLATYDPEDSFDHRTGEGFCKVWGLPLMVAGSRK